MNHSHLDPKSHPPRIHLASLGCAKNLIDSERLLARLAMSGAIVGAPVDEADILLVNTCGFIAPAREESLDVIRSYVEVKHETPGVRLFVLGCLGEKDGDGLTAAIPEVDGVFGLDADGAIAKACGLDPSAEEDARLLLTPAHTAYLRVSEGCDNACTYCTIPSIRGPFRSRGPAEIVREAEDLVAGGVRELNLIGQDTTSYGGDLDPRTSIDRLIRQIGAIEDLRWLRLLYAYPDHVTDELMAAYQDVDALIPYIDLPLQHLDSEILRRMGRGTTYEQIAHLIETLRSKIPGVTLRTTFIVGFPGETEAQFEHLLGGIETLRFDHVGVFGYSREEGTPAADFTNQIPDEEIDRRVEEAMLRQQSIVFEMHRSRVGSVVDVLIDAPSTEPDRWIGRTTSQAPDVDSVTLLHGTGLAAGQFVEARITGMQDYDLVATAIG